MKFQFAEETLLQAQDFQQHGQQFESTIATAFFAFENSKHDIQEYLDWAKNSMCLTDAMVIFTNVPEKLAPLREHAKDRTIIVPMETKDVQVGNDIHLTDKQWEIQHLGENVNINLFKVWAGKPWLVNQAVQLNPFRSDVFHWMDIGHFRDGPDFCGETVVRHPEVVPDDSMMMFMRRALAKFDDPESVVVKRRFGFTFIPGGWIAGRAHVWPMFLERFEETIAMYFLVGESIFEDQALLQTTCIRNEGLCSLVRRDNYVGYVDESEHIKECVGTHECKEKAGWMIGGNEFFSMKFYFWHGGNFKFWDPATGYPTEEEDFKLYHPFADWEGVAEGR